MNPILFVLMIAGVVYSSEPPIDSNFKNKIAVGLNGRLRYERAMGLGFHIGTDWKYILVIEGERLIHADQQPEFWLLTLSHQYESSFIHLENRISTVTNGFDGFSAKYDFQARKPYRFERRWAITPFIQLVEYVLDADALGEGQQSRRITHHAELTTRLGIELELFF